MKKILILTLMLALLATPALGALKMLEAALAQELEGLAKQAAAERYNVSIDKIEILDPWLQELFNIEVEVYNVPMLVDGNKVTEYVRVDNKQVLSQEEIEALWAENEANEPEEPIFRTMSIEVDADDSEAAATAAQQKTNYLPYALGALAVLGAGAYVVKTKLG